MKFRLEFAADNAAFGQWNEVARILRHLADDVDETAVEDLGGGTIRDFNGNSVGHWEVVEGG